MRDDKSNPNADRTGSEVLAKKLHEWYLEASSEVNSVSLNEKAQKEYDELNDDQKFLDKFIAKKILDYFKDK